MKTKTVQVFSIDELSEQAKQQAHSDWLRHKDYFWSAENQATLEAFVNIFPIEVKNWSYDSNSYDYNFTFTGSDDVANLSGWRLATYIWNNYRSDIFKGKYYGHLSPKDKHGNPIPKSKEHPIGQRHVKRNSRILLTNDCPLTGYCMDMEILDPIYKFLNSPDNSTTFEELLNTCIEDFFAAAQKDVEYSESEEYFIEECNSNEWEFLSNGERIDF